MNIFLTLFYGNDDVNNGNEKYDDHDDDNVNAISIRFVIFFFCCCCYLIYYSC